MNFFKSEFLKRITKFTLTTKCYMTKHCHSIIKLKKSAKMFADFSLNALIFQEISLSFLGFL